MAGQFEVQSTPAGALLWSLVLPRNDVDGAYEDCCGEYRREKVRRTVVPQHIGKHDSELWRTSDRPRQH